MNLPGENNDVSQVAKICLNVALYTSIAFCLFCFGMWVWQFSNGTDRPWLKNEVQVVE